MPKYLCRMPDCRNRRAGQVGLKDIKGWKRHMRDAHQTWTGEQLNEAVSGAVATPADQTSFEGFADSLPETESELRDGPAPGASQGTATPGPLPSTANLKTDAAAKKLNAKMVKLKRQLSEVFPDAVQFFIAGKGPEWTLEPEHREMLTESMESVFEMLDVQFQIQQVNVMLQSRLWVLLYPLAVLFLVLGLLTAKNSDKEKPVEGAAQGEPSTAVN